MITVTVYGFSGHASATIEYTSDQSPAIIENDSLSTSSTTTTTQEVEDSIATEAPLNVTYAEDRSPESETIVETISEKSEPRTEKTPLTVPFYSQFTDITAGEWKKVGCGIASLAMLIDYYNTNPPSVDTLLQEGINAHAYLNDAGWTYAGLIGISQKYGLTGESHDLASATMDNAFKALQTALRSGPVMVSVHYKFEPENPIPHLVIANSVRDGLLYYNDPAAKTGNLSISVNAFKEAWKKRYIEIRPLS